MQISCNSIDWKKQIRLITLPIGLVSASFLFAPTASAISLTNTRSLDGSGNNLGNPSYGQLGLNLVRTGSANYGDGISTLPGGPNVREISNQVFNQPTSILDPRGLSDFSWAWGQFLSHDISHTLMTNNEFANITIPNSDRIFTPGQAIPVTRSVFDPTTGLSTRNPRQQINNITAWIDGGVVYGGRASEPNGGTARANWLRTGFGGKLETSTFNGDVYLPVASQKADAPGMAEGSFGIDPDTLFVAGDVRANEHAVLTSLHTLMVREHNRLVDEIALNQAADLAGLTSEEQDEALYQAAKKIVGAQIQAVTYNEYLPSLGVTLEDYTGYDASITPNVANEFSTAGFRLGHSQISGVIHRQNADGTTHAAGDLNLFEGFFDPDAFLETDMDSLFRGLSATIQQKTDAKVANDLRNLLFGPPSMGPFLNGTDLASLNIQRGRDHGLDSYNNTRIAYGLAPVTTFAEITEDLELQQALASVYSTVDEVDLWVGMLAEDPLTDASVSELVNAILAEQFIRLRDGDQFWYENDADFASTGYLAKWGFDQSYFENLSLGQIIASNTNIKNGSLGQHGNVFFASSLKPESTPEPKSVSVLSAFITLGILAAWKQSSSLSM
ncbi:MAG: peroxidase family protein [Leptolyngbyaceae cyanobacterium MO_188.B28]|nr:peroxidase family protein [Leptolyngbyaceae cyanobacterium MO_188.B28]